MRVTHVVNLVDEIGSYGGPLRVAANQVGELVARGEQAMLLAGATAGGRRCADDVLGALPRRLAPSFRVGGSSSFAWRWSPGTHGWLARHARSSDVVHVHLGRDLTTAPAAALLLALRVPYVVQTHGMVDPSHRRSAAVLDRLLVRRVLSGARRVLVLTEHERADVTAVLAGAPARIEVIPNGVRLADVTPTPDDEQPEVLFLSRLHERKRPLAFARAASELLAEGVRARFTLVGPDEGELAGVQAAVGTIGDPARLAYAGTAAMGGSVERISRAAVFVLPSVDEPFPMALLEAMSAGVPVVCSRSCGLADLVEQAGAGVVVPDDEPAPLRAAIRSLVDDPAEARAAGARGRQAVGERLSITAVVDRLTEIYADAAGGRVSR